MKNVFLLFFLANIPTFSATPPGGLAFNEDKKNQKDRFSLRHRCVHAAKAGVYAIPVLVAHSFMAYVTHKTITDTEHFHRTYDLYYPNRKLGAFLVLHACGQGLCYCCATMSLCSQTDKHCDAACHPCCRSEKKQRSKKKHNAPHMARDE
jgi:hypothetical protein